MDEATVQTIPISISIVDDAGRLVAFMRQEGCSYFAIEASRKKAITASQLKAPTHALADAAQKNPALQAAFTKNDEILTLPGGLPIVQNGKVVGGLGVAGGDFNQDKTIAEKAFAIA